MKEYIVKAEFITEGDELVAPEIVRELIRCKDCKYYQQGRNADEWLWCMMNHHYTDEETYCAWGEPKEQKQCP